MWPYKQRTNHITTIIAQATVGADGVVTVDVRGQTCPGYLLAINKAVDQLTRGTTVRLLITYPPCGDDVKAWCTARNIEYKNIERDHNVWVITIKI